MCHADSLTLTVTPPTFVLHSKEDELLRSCYRESLKLAAQNNLESISFPCISTGAYRFPPERASEIALREIQAFLETHPDFKEINVICFNETSREPYLAQQNTTPR